MSYLRKKFLPWVLTVANLALLTMSTAGATTFATAIVTDRQSINLASNWNAWVTLQVFLVSWLVQFFVGLGGLLKQSPLPIPDEDPLPVVVTNKATNPVKTEEQ